MNRNLVGTTMEGPLYKMLILSLFVTTIQKQELHVAAMFVIELVRNEKCL
jgi:hypothetical protein